MPDKMKVTVYTSVDEDKFDIVHNVEVLSGGVLLIHCTNSNIGYKEYYNFIVEGGD